MSQERFVELLETNDNLNDIRTYLADYQNESIGDLLVINNLGLVRRDGEERIVILDDGLNDETINLYRK